MPVERGAAQPASERLARSYFAAVSEGDVPGLLDLLHPDIQLSLKTRGGQMLRGRDEVERFLHEQVGSLYEASGDRYLVIDEERVIVEGRMRWMDEERVLRDDAVVWALEFRDGLLVGSTPARSVGEAQAILAAATPAGPREASTS